MRNCGPFLYEPFGQKRKAVSSEADRLSLFHCLHHKSKPLSVISEEGDANDFYSEAYIVLARDKVKNRGIHFMKTEQESTKVKAHSKSYTNCEDSIFKSSAGMKASSDNHTDCPQLENVWCCSLHSIHRYSLKTKI